MSLVWPHRLQSYHDNGGGENVFGDWLDGPGYQYVEAASLRDDDGETAPSPHAGHTILALNWDFRRTSQDKNYQNVDNKLWQFELAKSPDFDLHGGEIRCAVLIEDSAPEYYPNRAHQPPSSGRHWLMTRDVNVGCLSNFATTAFYVPSSGWACSYSRLGTPLSQVPQPDLRVVRMLVIGIVGYSQLPTQGVLACKGLRII